MRKHIAIRIVSILLLGVLITGCDKKSTDIVLEEPVVTANDNTEQGPDSERADDANNMSESKEPESEADSAFGDSYEDMPQTIMVHVCGAVICEGVYELPTGSRVVDAIKAAGGFMQDADTDFINQALVLEDGIKIKIPTEEESLASGNSQFMESADVQSDMAGITGMATGGTNESAPGDDKVNINTASEAELCNIPGIGPSRARSIIAYREEKGKFGTIEDIKNVTGIKEKFFSKIKDHIKV
ncbi:helix-hairpin-helix domain-containing protein [Butyrivibrio sp. JL13D10]|uniref:helix-hairpin-helix domain-containing protein n=1 Tax=Butyrivibrio sp. JL13D10 TaxID=3236815 RepID=UPI0038B48AC2